jgi:hypothetical protein
VKKGREERGGEREESGEIGFGERRGDKRRGTSKRADLYTIRRPLDSSAAVK